MKRSSQPFRVAAVQATPVFLDRDTTVEKACGLIREVGEAGASLAVFPECFIPTYPLWAWFIPPFKTQELREPYSALVANAVEVPGPVTERLGQAAAEAGVDVVMGVNEVNVEASGTTLYNTILFITRDGHLLAKHRKLVPTVAERMVHAQGDGSTLAVHDLAVGRVGGLICWENYMPLARYSLYAWGMEILAAPTWDRGEPWTSTLRHIGKEGRVIVVGCGSLMRPEDIPDRWGFKQYLPQVEWINPGGSAIVDPDGKFIVEPVMGREEILIAEIDRERFAGPRFQLDVAGHYGRPDVFELTVHRQRRPMLRLDEEPAPNEDPASTDGEESEG